MKNFNKQNSFTAVLLIAFMLYYGCSASRGITQFQELHDAYDKNEPVRALGRDSVYYTFNSFTYTDSTISGTGTRDDETFEGTLAFSEIVFMERLTKSVGKGLWMVPVMAGLVGGTYALAQPPNFEIWRPVSSCPFIYAFNGTGYVLEAEAFSTAISKALETQTYHVLRSLASEHGKVKVRISNERPETHIFNSVKLFVVDMPPSGYAIPDTDHNIWAVSGNKPPVIAQDPAGKDVRSLLVQKDDRYWRPEMKELSSRSDFRDSLLLQFEKPKDTSNALLIVDAINSELITEIYRTAGAVIGEDRLGFYHALEQDPKLQSYFRDWIDRSSLLVEIKSEDGWMEAGRLLPEANEVSFSRAIRLNNLDRIEADSDSLLTLRISSMTDVWYLDAISVDYSAGGPLPMEPLKLISLYTTGPGDDREIKTAISAADSSYAMLLPPDYMELTFDASPADDMQHPAYVIAAQGYLYEWFPDPEGVSQAAPVIPEWFKNIDREDMLRFFTGREDLFLRAIYAGWEQRGNKEK